jgi:hypothetical protein
MAEGGGMIGLHRVTAGMALLAMGATVSAQSTFVPGQAGRRDNRVQAGIVIPFGSAGTSAERAPRLEAWSQQGWQRESAELRMRADRDPGEAQPIRMGITLNQRPRMMLNGREVPGQDDRHGVSTLSWVGIGLGVAVIAFGFGLADAAKQANN